LPFQSTPLHERRRLRSGLACRKTSFNPRPCTRGDRIVRERMGRPAEFQSTPLHEGRPVEGVMN